MGHSTFNIQHSIEYGFIVAKAVNMLHFISKYRYFAKRKLNRLKIGNEWRMWQMAADGQRQAITRQIWFHHDGRCKVFLSFMWVLEVVFIFFCCFSFLFCHFIRLGLGTGFGLSFGDQESRGFAICYGMHIAHCFNARNWGDLEWSQSPSSIQLHQSIYMRWCWIGPDPIIIIIIMLKHTMCIVSFTIYLSRRGKKSIFTFRQRMVIILKRLKSILFALLIYSIQNPHS